MEVWRTSSLAKSLSPPATFITFFIEPLSSSTSTKSSGVGQSGGGGGGEDGGEGEGEGGGGEGGGMSASNLLPIRPPYPMTVSTTGPRGQPSSRYAPVASRWNLLRGFDNMQRQ